MNTMQSLEDEYHAIIKDYQCAHQTSNFKTQNILMAIWLFKILNYYLLKAQCLLSLSWFYSALAQYRSQSTKYASESVN